MCVFFWGGRGSEWKKQRTYTEIQWISARTCQTLCVQCMRPYCFFRLFFTIGSVAMGPPRPKRRGHRKRTRRWKCSQRRCYGVPWSYARPWETLCLVLAKRLDRIINTNVHKPTTNTSPRHYQDVTKILPTHH